MEYRIYTVIVGMQLQSPLLYDSNADRVPNFWMWSFSPHQSKFEVAVEMVMTDPPDKVLILLANLFRWIGM